MAFDPDKYLSDSEFDPDAYLAENSISTQMSSEQISEHAKKAAKSTKRKTTLVEDFAASAPGRFITGLKRKQMKLLYYKLYLIQMK